MDELFMQTQIAINEMRNKQIEILTRQIEFLIGVVEDHEADMAKMAEKINYLESLITEK